MANALSQEALPEESRRRTLRRFVLTSLLLLSVTLFAWNAPTDVRWALGAPAACLLLYTVLAVGVLRPTATSTARSELVISLNWLGLGLPRPNSRRRKLIKIAVWCLIIPGVLAFFQFAFINRWVGEAFPVTDPGIRERRAMTGRISFCRAGCTGYSSTPSSALPCSKNLQRGYCR